MEISRKIELDYGHTLPNHYSFCSQLHGHRATVIVVVEGEIDKEEGSSSQGMVFDFKLLKDAMMTHIHKVLDHGFAVWEKDTLDLEFIMKRNKKYVITKQPPTAEYLAEWAYNQIKDHLPKNILLKEVHWYETPTSAAVFRG